MNYSPQVNRREAMLTKSLSFHQESFSPKCPSEDEDMIYIVDEMDSSNSNSPNHLGSVGGGGAMAMTRSYHEDVMYYGMSGSTTASMRPKNKLEVKIYSAEYKSDKCFKSESENNALTYVSFVQGIGQSGYCYHSQSFEQSENILKTPFRETSVSLLRVCTTYYTLLGSNMQVLKFLL